MKYQFKCPECHDTKEVEGPIEEGPPYVPWCTLCSLFAPKGVGMVWMKRVWDAAPVIFRGSGWASKS